MREKIKIIAVLASILLAVFLSFTHFASKVSAADTSNYCADDVRMSDLSQIDLITKSTTSNVKKGDDFVVLIQNIENEYGATYSVDILKQDQSVIQKTGSLEGMIGLNNYAQEIFSTGTLDIANYTIKVKFYHADLHCLLRMETYPLNVIATEDLSAPNGVTLFDKGEVKIGTSDTQITAGGIWKATIQNNFSTDFQYKIKVNDLKTGEFLLKTAGTVQAGMEEGAWATIVTPGSHTAKVEIYDSSGNNLLYTQDFPVTVTKPAKGAVATVETSNDKVNGTIGANSSSAGTGTTSGSGVGVGVPITGKESTHYTYSEYLCAVYYWALNIGFGLTILMFMYAGYRYMTAAGNDAVFTDTKDILTSAILGFLLLLMIRLVLHVLNVPEPDKCFPSTTATILNHLSAIRSDVL